jgi:carboxyl-terminal processing protease
MLPLDPNDPAVARQPGDPDMPVVEADVTRPQPTGLVDETILTPVLRTPGERRRGWPLAVALVLVTIMGGGALFLSGFAIGRDQGRTPGSDVSEQQAWGPFWTVYDAIRQRFPLEPVDRKTLVEGAIRGMVESIGDPYSSYLSPEDFQGTIDDISGTFEGIGAEIGAVDSAGNASDCSPFGPDCHMVIIAPLEGSPAEGAGLKSGDVIGSVDGKTLDGLTPDEARDMVRGKAGSEVTLHILRYAAPRAATAPPVTPTPSGSPAPGATGAPGLSATPREPVDEFDVKLVRAKIQRREVTARELGGGTVGYIRLSGFSDDGAKQLQTALKADVDKGIKKVILDLRGNPGGFVTAARSVASQFLADGPVYWTQKADGTQEEVDAEGGGVATDPAIQLVVLIDRGSASASEIVAGALQDRGRAQLIGETSFGKGTVQQWYNLEQLGGVKLTVEKWLTPDKRWIHKIGLTPDVPVTVPTDLPPGSDPVLDKALDVLGATAMAPWANLRAA